MNIDEIIHHALREDIGDGDHTSIATIPAGVTGKAQLVAKEDGILAGVYIAEKVFRKVDPEIDFIILIPDGSQIRRKEIVFRVEGNPVSILTAERLALNFLQRMSGIATFTYKLNNQLQGLKCRLLDTRKTTPLLRELEKYAVSMGGGQNHRMGLYDMVMIKDNHIDFAGGIKKAIDAVHRYLENSGKKLKIEIEVRNFIELQEVLNEGGVNRVMLDNFSPSDLAVAVKMIGGKFETEASGGINADNLRSFAETGVDYISVGALTHQIKSLDLSLVALK
ncbi:MAG: carboxylating nicotinate-nucleotide diphosphorylase [Bacteroidetes bacterium]|nr:carboxylating nicotinate-nucleotide diphosphorylase [Bacteroidota bacterium]